MSTPSAPRPVPRTAAGDPVAVAAARRRKNLALMVIAACQLMIVLDATVVNIALPDLQKALDFSPSNLAWVPNSYTLTFGGLLLLGGRAGDILGRRRVFIAGVVLFGVASLFGGLATSSEWLLVARALQGVGGAIASPTALALVATNFEEGAERNRALAVFMAVSGSGSAMGLIVGGALTSWISWRWVFFINVPIAVLAAVAAPRFIRESQPQPGRFDLAGAVLSTGGIAALVYAFIRAASDGWDDDVALASFAAAALLLVLFVVLELWVTQPITPLRLMRDRNRSSSYLIMLLLLASMMGVFFYLSQFMQVVLGYSALRTGLAFLPTTIALMIAAQIASGLVTRVGPRPIAVTGTALTTAGLLWLTRIADDSTFAGSVLGPLTLFSVGSGMLFVTLALTAVAGVRAEDSGAASSLLNVMQPVGGSLGLAALVTVYASAAEEAVKHPPAGATPVTMVHHVMAEGMSSAYLLAAAFGAAALVTSFFLRPLPTSEVASELPEPAAAPAP